MWVLDAVDFGIVQVVSGISGADAFNFFFTLTWVFGLVAMATGLLLRVVSRS